MPIPISYSNKLDFYNVKFSEEVMMTNIKYKLQRLKFVNFMHSGNTYSFSKHWITWTGWIKPKMYAITSVTITIFYKKNKVSIEYCLKFDKTMLALILFSFVFIFVSMFMLVIITEEKKIIKEFFPMFILWILLLPFWSIQCYSSVLSFNKLIKDVFKTG